MKLLNYIIKYAVLMIFITNSFHIFKTYDNHRKQIPIDNKHYSITSTIKNITNIPIIHLKVSPKTYYYSTERKLIEITYFIKFKDENYHLIKPSDISLFYNLHIFCSTFFYEENEKIYSIANIYKNKYFVCVEHKKLEEHVKLGIKIYRINELKEEIEYNEMFFFIEQINNININWAFENNNKFDINQMYNNYFKILLENLEDKHKKDFMRSSFLQPPLFSLKRDISQIEGRWYFKNIFETYFCFCKGESCINIISLKIIDFQSCKYYFFLTIIYNNRNLYPKEHYLLSDFFDENIESADAFPIFREMINQNLNAHYLTMSPTIYNTFCLNNIKCFKKYFIIYGVRKINGDFLEKYLELFLRLKVVVAAEKYDSIDNIFYNIGYITYIFLGHGVTYIKSYLYQDYLSPKRYNKILLPPSERFISLALEAGWKIEDIVKIGYPKWDKYVIHKNLKVSIERNKEKEKSIFLMFTWRKIKKGKNLSDLYYKNIDNILNNRIVNEQLQKNNVKLFFCFHHALREKRKFNITNNIRIISQNDISVLLKNCSLVITDFSSIIFDAIVQKKPLILYIPDGLDPNLENIYVTQYYETITKLKNGLINIIEIFLYLKDVINKISYYIENNFVLEEEKMRQYNEFRLKAKGNTRKFIKYIKMLH